MLDYSARDQGQLAVEVRHQGVRALQAQSGRGLKRLKSLAHHVNDMSEKTLVDVGVTEPDETVFDIFESGPSMGGDVSVG